MLPNRENGMRKCPITCTVFKPAKCPVQVSQGMCNNSLEISKSWLYTAQFPWTQREEYPEPPEKETESPFSTAHLLGIPFPFGSVIRWPDTEGEFFPRDCHWWSEAPAVECALDSEPRPKPSLLLVSKQHESKKNDTYTILKKEKNYLVEITGDSVLKLLCYVTNMCHQFWIVSLNI